MRYVPRIEKAQKHLKVSVIWDEAIENASP
jgi:hypothetical protein